MSVSLLECTLHTLQKKWSVFSKNDSKNGPTTPKTFYVGQPLQKHILCAGLCAPVTEFRDIRLVCSAPGANWVSTLGTYLSYLSCDIIYSSYVLSTYQPYVQNCVHKFLGVVRAM